MVSCERAAAAAVADTVCIEGVCLEQVDIADRENDALFNCHARRNAQAVPRICDTGVRADIVIGAAVIGIGVVASVTVVTPPASCILRDRKQEDVSAAVTHFHVLDIVVCVIV